ncbi:diaminopimelate epimerase [soil metagenome]
MTFRLTKHHGLGNDFLVLLTDDPVVAGDGDAWVERAVRWCDRRRGVGADGLLVGLRNSAEADLVMWLVNADGTRAEMSGNGIRCLAQAEARRRTSDHGELTIATGGGPRCVRYRPDPDGDPNVVLASVDMGPAGPGPPPDREVDLEGTDLPSGLGNALVLEPIKRATLDLGNPHLVLLVDEPESVDVMAAGSTHEAAFDAGMNVHFVAPTVGEADAMDMVVWERGAGITEACGTGAAAVARAAHDWGLVGERVTVHMPGGDVVVDVGPTMILHGPSVHVADVEVPA